MNSKRWSSGLGEALFFWFIGYGLVATAVVMLGGATLLDAATPEFNIEDNRRQQRPHPRRSADRGAQ